MKSYTVIVVIENKPEARDPEGDTICRNLILQSGYSSVKSVRTGKYLRMLVEARSAEEAKNLVSNICNNLRLFNPAVHRCTIELKED